MNYRLSIGLIIWPLVAGAAVPRIPALDLRRAQLNDEAVNVVDVRNEGDYVAGHIQDAVNHPRGEMGTPEWGKQQKIVVYCKEDPCPLTDKAVEMLTAMGYKDVVILGGGLDAWVAKKYPVVKGSGKPVAARPKRIGVADVKKRLDKGDLTILDTRSAADFAAGHVKGAVSAPFEGFNPAALGISKVKDVLVYDKVAGRSRAAADKLTEAGYKAHEMPGGILGWIKKGNKLEVK